MRYKSRSEMLFDIFEKELPAYYKTEDIRISQVQMAMDVADFISNSKEKFLFIEAPVGTGKSLGALVPSMMESEKGNNYNVIYATATINLQGQLMDSEIPLLKKLSLVRQPILAKGKTHYYCHQEFQANKSRFSPKEQEIFSGFYQHAETGQRNELEDTFDVSVSEGKWLKLALKNSFRKCERCKFSFACPTFAHRKQFHSKRNDLLITNHDQLIRSALNQLNEPIQEPIIPIDTGLIIIDEAHHFLENFLSQKEEMVLFNSMYNLTQYIPQKNKGRFRALLRDIKEVLVSEAPNEVSMQGRYPIPNRALVGLKEINVIIKDAIIEVLSKDLYSYSTREESIAKDLEEVSVVLDYIKSDRFVKWMSYEDMSFSAISETFATDFRELLLYFARRNKVIVMSGTLMANGDFETILNQWRLRTSEVVTKRYNSPFDYQNQALVYIPNEIKEPSHSSFIYDCLDHIRSLLSLTLGRSLILTTSKIHMKAISENIAEELSEQNIQLLVQDQSGVERLTKDFKSDETSVLVGSGSFFSGFSVPGKALISVILSKLPFPVPDDPFLKLIGQGYEDDLFQFVLFPQMINKLNQAAGRLIRDIEDFGVFTIFDRRIFTMEYGIKIKENFANQGYILTRSFKDVETFIDRKLHNGSESKYVHYIRENVTVSEKLSEPIKKWEKKIIEGTPRKKISNSVTKDQREFAKSICKQEGERYPRGTKTSDELYEFLINIYAYEWRDISLVVNDFPFRDKEEQQRLQKIPPTKRKMIMPSCTSFGCDGTECQKNQKIISQQIIEEFDATEVKFIRKPSNGMCNIFVEPTELINKLNEKLLLISKK